MLQRLKASVAAIGPPGKIDEPSIASKGIFPRTIVTQTWTLCRSILRSMDGHRTREAKRAGDFRRPYVCRDLEMLVKRRLCATHNWQHM